MRRVLYFIISAFICSAVTTQSSYAVLDRYNVGVGYSAANQLAISTDTPGEFDYYLYLRAADNTGKTVSVHYNGVNNLQRTITLGCGTDESNATDNPQTGTCLSGGPFVRGAFVAGNNNQYAVVKRFTLFCGTVQIVGEQSTNNWSSGDFYNDAIKDFLDNGASSTWCPPTSTPSPTPTKSLTKSVRPTVRPTRKPTPTTQPTPAKIDSIVDEVTPLPTLTPTIVLSQVSSQKTTPDKMKVFWIGIISIILVSVGIVVGYIKIFGEKTTESTDLPIEDEVSNGETTQNKYL